MRFLVTVLALTLTCAAAVTAAEVCPPGNAGLGAGPAQVMQMTGDEAFDACLARSLGVTPDQLAALRAQNLTNADLVQAASISRRANQPIQDVIAQYKLTPNWQAVSDYYRVSYPDTTINASLLNSDNNAFNAAFISQQYGMSVADINALRSQNLSWGEINLIANASVRTGLSPQQLATLRSQGVSWQDIGNRYNVSVDQLTAPCALNAPRLSCCAAIAAGPVCTRPVLPVLYDSAGNVLLTQDEVFRLYSKGYSWVSVGIAANISRATGYPVEQVLTDLTSGLVWEQVAAIYGVAPNVAFNLSCYPFPRCNPCASRNDDRQLARIAPYQSTITVPVGTPIPVLPGTCTPPTLTQPVAPTCPPVPVCPPPAGVPVVVPGAGPAPATTVPVVPGATVPVPPATTEPPTPTTVPATPTY